MELESFRLKWKAELQAASKQPSEIGEKPVTSLPVHSSSASKGYVQQHGRNKPFAKKLYSVPEYSSPDDNSPNGLKFERNQESTQDERNANNNDDAPANSNNAYHTLSEEEKEKKAKALFSKGVELERSGKLYESIQQYKKAMQLVPDIEKKSQYVVPEVSDDEESDAEDFGDLPQQNAMEEASEQG